MITVTNVNYKSNYQSFICSISWITLLSCIQSKNNNCIASGDFKQSPEYCCFIHKTELSKNAIIIVFFIVSSEIVVCVMLSSSTYKVFPVFLFINVLMSTLK